MRYTASHPFPEQFCVEGILFILPITTVLEYLVLKRVELMWKSQSGAKLQNSSNQRRKKKGQDEVKEVNGFRQDAGGPHQEKHDEPMPSPAQGPDSTCAHFQLLQAHSWIRRIRCSSRKHEVARCFRLLALFAILALL